MTLKDKSWKTALAGSLNSLSTMILGAGIVPGLTDMSYAQKLQPLIITGFVLKAASEFFHGWAARDNDKCSEDVGLRCGSNGITKPPAS